MKFFVLVQRNLMQFQAEKDVGLAPTSCFNLENCSVEAEGPKKNHFHVFSLISETRETLLRLSTESKGDLQRWLDALEAAGCPIASLASESQPSRAPSVAASAAHGAGDVGDTATSGGLRRRRGGEEAPGEEPGPSANNRGGDAHGKKTRYRRGMTGSTPVHREPKYSLLSSEQLSYQRHSGLVNLGMVIIVSTNFRLILENVMKYGLRFRPWTWMGIGATDPQPIGILLSWPFLGLAILCALLIERLLAGRLAKEQGSAALTTERLGLLLNVANTSAALLVPCFMIYKAGPRASPIPAFVLVFASVITWMKLVSYAHCNADCRDARRKGESLPGERGSDEEVQGLQHRVRYPEQLTLRNIAYFIAAPTLCYQISFPSSSRIRVRWLLRRLIELLVYSSLLIFLVSQYVEPAVANSMRAVDDLDWIKMLERVLKLSLPVLYVWICMFYVFFHVYLNILAELLRFGDRIFYLDWWNATTFETYWRSWNIPVHRWMLRTVYYPLVRRKVPRQVAMFLVFFVSAIFHELIVGLPLHMVRAWAFVGILLQVPMIVLTNWLRSRIKNEQLGNVIFWITFCFVGQPISVLLYSHDWILAQQKRRNLLAVGVPPPSGPPPLLLAGQAAPGLLGDAGEGALTPTLIDKLSELAVAAADLALNGTMNLTCGGGQGGAEGTCPNFAAAGGD